MFKEIIREELKNMKQEMEELKRMMQEGACGPPRGMPNKYSDIVKEKKKENVIIIKPKTQQESEATKKMIKEKVDIKNMEVGITKLRRGGGGAVILGCESKEGMEKIKATVQATMGEEVKVSEPQRKKLKIKIVNVGGDEIKMNDEELIDSIKKQKRIEGDGEEFSMRIVKKIFKGRKVNNERSGRRGEDEGSLIMELDDSTHETLINKGKINIG